MPLSIWLRLRKPRPRLPNSLAKRSSSAKSLSRWPASLNPLRAGLRLQQAVVREPVEVKAAREALAVAAVVDAVVVADLVVAAVAR
jgi:hypothetical protein